MRARLRLLLLTGGTLAAEAKRLLPAFACTHTENEFEAIVAAGETAFDGMLVSDEAAANPARLIESIRRIAPSMRIVVSCQPDREAAIRTEGCYGADAYVLEPLRSSDVLSAMALNLSAAEQTAGAPRMDLAEIYQIADLLEQADEGVETTLSRLAGTIMLAFRAQSVHIQVERHEIRVGDAGAKPSVAEPVLRDGQPVGELRIAGGNVAVGLETTLRLREYARLAATAVMLANKVHHWRELAWRDELSGLHNRRYFEKALAELSAGAAQDRTRLTVLLFDIDNFKEYNDRYGHETGDELIREIAVLLRRCSRETDVVARYGGDEFGVIMWDAGESRVPGSQHPTSPLALAQRFCSAIAGHQFKCLGPAALAPVTISGGLATLPWDGTTSVEIIRAADRALLEAKTTGKNKLALSEGTR